MQNLNASRDPAVAGSFYSNDKKELSLELKSLLTNAPIVKQKDVKALIVPHAGYIFSAKTAATAYSTLQKEYKNIFIIGSSHHYSFDSASIYRGNYKTPLGEIKMSNSAISQLMKNPSFIHHKDAHTKEHTLEVQLPFLQTIYGKKLSIVPIIMGTQKLDTIIEISKILKPFFEDKENLFIISTDLSHYPSYEDANRVDMKTLNALTKNSSQEFINTIVKNEESHIEALNTSACGWSSLLLLLNMTQNENYQYEILDYKNSGDTKYGDKKRVVGYGALRVSKKSEEFFLTAKEKNELLELAKLSLYEATINKKKITIDEKNISPKLKQNIGAFVTLYTGDKLRGCIGRFEPNQALYSVIIDMTIAAGFQDHRFKEVNQEELENIDIEISVLTPRKKINSLNEIEIGKHGIYLQNGNKTGTYLPHVAPQMNWNVEKFVSYCAEEKAGISKDEMNDTQIYTYEAIVFDKK